jgi:hypothetical protein
MLGRWIIEPGLGGANGLKAAGYDPKILCKELQITADIMKVGGYGANELAKAGYAWSDLKANFTIPELREEGYTLQQLRLGGFSAYELHQGGFPKYQLLALGVPEWEIITKPKLYQG